MQQPTYKLNDPDVVLEDFGADAVLLDLGSGDYYSVAGQAKPFLAGVLSSGDVPGLIEGLQSKDLNAGAAAQEMLDALVSKALLVPDDVGPEERVEPDAVIKEILATEDGFKFDSHSDLSDVIAADPIHDV